MTDITKIHSDALVAQKVINQLVDDIASLNVEDPPVDPIPPIVPVDPTASPHEKRIGMNINQGGKDAQVWGDLLANEMWNVSFGQERLKFPADNRIQECVANIHIDAKKGDRFKLHVDNGGRIECFGQTFDAGEHTIELKKDYLAEVFRVHKPGFFACYREKDDERFLDSRYESLIQPFDILRGLDPLRTNNSPQRFVNQHIERSHPCQSSPTYGCAIGEFLDLCAEVDCHAWVLIPHLAERELVTHFAEECKAFKLATGLDVYVEYSNEVWNLKFQQSKWALQQGKDYFAQGEGEDRGKWSNRVKAQWYGKKCVETFKVFDESFVDYIRVLAWQAHSNWTQQVVLDQFVIGYGRKPDRFAIAPYLHLPIKDWVDSAVESVFGIPAKEKYIQWRGRDGEEDVEAEEDQVDEFLAANWNPQLIVDEMFVEGQGIDRSKHAMSVYKAFSDKNDVPICSYENGQHIIPPVNRYDRFNKILEDCQSDTRWPEIYRQHRLNWQSFGFLEDCYLSCVQRPRRGTGFGHRERVDVNHPKWNALSEIMNSQRS